MVVDGWALLLLVLLIVASPLSLLYPLLALKRQVARLVEAELPRIEGFTEWELKNLLAHAARLEFPLDDRPRKAFSRRNMADLIGRDRFETLRDGLARLGYLEPANERGTHEWTVMGRLLLMQVISGRFGPVVNVMRDKNIMVCDNQLTGFEVVDHIVVVK